MLSELDRRQRRGRRRPRRPWLIGAAALVLLACAVAACQVAVTVHGDGAAYDPARDAWRRLAPSPQPRGSLLASHLVWTGTRLLVWSDWRQTLRSEPVTLTDGQRATELVTQDRVDLWAYDPAADRWAVLPPAPGQPPLGGAEMLWTGEEVLSISGRPYGGPALGGDPGARYDPERNRWRRLADGPLDAAALPAALWTGAALLVWNGISNAGWRFRDGLRAW